MDKIANAIAATPAAGLARKLRSRAVEIPKNPLFAALSRQQLKLILPHVKCRRVRRGKKLLEEGARNKGRIYIVVDGLVTISKDGISLFEKDRRSYDIGTLRRGEIFGEASFLDRKPSQATFAAKTDLTVAVLDLSASGRNFHIRRLRKLISAELRRNIAQLTDKTLALRLNSIRREKEFAAYRTGVGHIVVTTLSLLSVYTLGLSFLPSFKSLSHANIVLSPLIIMLFTLSFIPIIANSGFPLSFFGLRLDNWRAALSCSLRATALFLLGFLAGKWVLIQTVPALNQVPLIGVGHDGRHDGLAPMSTLYWVALIVYLLLTPLQEFVARSSIQAPLYAFLNGSETRRRWFSILVSNMVFTAAHAHISAAFTLAAFLPGMLWGWIFARTQSLFAVTVSHLLIGGVTIFLLGVETLVAKLTAL